MIIPKPLLPYCKLTALLLVVLLNGAGLMAVGNTIAYYNDTETAPNIFEASIIDFILSVPTFETQIGPEEDGEKTYFTVAMPEDASSPMEYSAKLTGATSTPLCSELLVDVKRNGVTQYEGPFSDFSLPSDTEFGSFAFRFDMPPDAVAAHGDTCSVQAVWSALGEGTTLPNTFTDEETTDFTFTARMVVLNEIFPAPGEEEAPKDREYVELFNNGITPVDVAGWQISELSGSTEVKYPIVAAGAVSGEVQPYDGASTTIAPGGYLVLEFGGGAPELNNSGDTVRLYDSADTLLDEHAYPAVPDEKSVVRYPDGIGFWVDPEPTPGGKNAVSMKDLEDAGFSEEMIQRVLELAALKGQTLSEDGAEGETDYSAPIITLSGNNPALIPQGSTYADLGAIVSDNVNENLGYQTEGEVDTETLGEYTITYTAADQAGNVGTAERTVIVYDPEVGPPEAELAPSQPQEEVPEESAGGGSAAPTEEVQEDEEAIRDDEEVKETEEVEMPEDEEEVEDEQEGDAPAEAPQEEEVAEEENEAIEDEEIEEKDAVEEEAAPEEEVADQEDEAVAASSEEEETEDEEAKEEASEASEESKEDGESVEDAAQDSSVIFREEEGTPSDEEQAPQEEVVEEVPKEDNETEE